MAIRHMVEGSGGGRIIYQELKDNEGTIDVFESGGRQVASFSGSDAINKLSNWLHHRFPRGFLPPSPMKSSY